MAERMEGTLQGGRKYRWEEWTDGGVWCMTPSEDYSCTTESFRSICRATARARGLHVRTLLRHDGKLLVQFFQNADPTANHIEIPEAADSWWARRTQR